MMTITRNPLVALAAGLTFAAGTLTPFHVDAAQGQGRLAQYPLSITNVIPPAFIMAVDDSGSMRFQGIFGGPEGAACWDGSSFFAEAGVLNTSGGSCADRYYVYTHAGSRVANNNAQSGFPPLDNFGFARSPQFNRGYFDPNVEYLPWLTADGTPYEATAGNPAGNADVTNTRIDPRENGTIRLFENRRNTSDFVARSRSGMVIPAGAIYYSSSNNNNAVCGLHSNSNTVRNSLGNSWYQLRQNRPLNGECNLYFEYYPATFYLRTDTPAALQPSGYRTTTAARPVIANACGAGCDLWRYEIREANFQSTADFQRMRQNFANWFSFYGNRNRALIAGMTRAFVDVNNIRTGYFSINQIPSGNLSMYDLAVPSEKSEIFDLMLATPSVGGTPNPNAVRYGLGQFSRTGAGAPVQLACQRNALLLFTDGYSNTSNVTETQAPQVSGLGRPFDPTPAQSVAALATRYYLNTNNTVGAGGTSRINTTLPSGQVPVPAACATPPTGYDPEFAKLNCQSNLHVNFFGIVLGPSGELYDPADPKDPFVDELDDWPGYEAAMPSTIDDIWHATINTRGEFIDAATPAEITTAMRRVLAAVGGGEAPSGSIALTGARVGDGAFVVEPRFESRNEGTDWFGQLRAFELQLQEEGGFSYVPRWEASERLPAHAARNIFFATAIDSVTPTVRSFQLNQLGSSPRHTLCSSADPLSRCSPQELAAFGSDAQIVDFLRGDQSRANGNQMRLRTSALGDIVNSTPAISERKDNYGYSSLRGSEVGEFDPLGYREYLEEKAEDGFERVVFVGANDGMLHAFDGRTGASGGTELFAFIPSTAVGHLGNLLYPYNPADQQDQKFQHTYFVDGPIAVSDAYFGNGWHSVLVGTAGAGGRSVFGLDVSRPDNFEASDVLWELTPGALGVNGVHLGHVLSQPIIVPVRDEGRTEWKAIFGNGFDSEAGRAALFVVNIADGDTRVILAEEGDSAPDYANGLGGIVGIDRYDSVSDDDPVPGTDGLVDTVYGGDLHGNIWKFDLTDNSVGLGGEPLFTADLGGQRQPITGGLEVAAGPGGGVMIYFGTGSFSFENDAVDESRQSLYGILDRGTPIAGRASLRQQYIDATEDEGVRNVASSVVSFINQRGWFIDLAPRIGEGAEAEPVEQGERMVGNPRLSEGTIFFPTYEPGGADGGSDPCAPGGRNWLYGLSALSGGAAMSGLRIGSPDADPMASGTGAVRLDAAGSSPVRNIAVALVPRLDAVDPTGTSDDIEECDKVVSTAGFVGYQARACGRQSWRQIR